ncbi:hypothetical protein CI1B_13210 [Bradyrhizobium ivorense]|uniref:Uncharacterized protein n=1 Tax=Bradyrhizobium ivorense TaxID=2511166 RepID=A0A508SZD1_9BRAD|nr:hypothetical protein CI1B_13210 [Bradyrhizobium ivorense]
MQMGSLPPCGEGWGEGWPRVPVPDVDLGSIGARTLRSTRGYFCLPRSISIRVIR